MTIKVGVLGTGFAEEVQIPGFQNHEQFDIVGIWGHRQKRTQEVATALDIPVIFQDWKELVSSEDVDLVSVVTPVHQHFEMTMEAFDNNKHVLCEKPMALDSAEAMRMHQESIYAELVGMINHEFRQLPERRYLHNLVRSGELGQIYEVNIDVSSPGRLPHLSGSRNWNWWADSHHGGGLWGALGSHLIDFILWTFGSIDKITGQLRTNTTHLSDQSTNQSRLVTSDDSFYSLFTTANNIQGRLTGSATRHGKGGTTFEVFGEKGSLRIDKDRTLWGGQEDTWRVLEIPEGYKLREVTEGEDWLIPPFEVLLTHLAKGIQSGNNPSPSFGDGLNVQLVLDALREASVKKSWISI